MSLNQEQRAILKPIPSYPTVIDIIKIHWGLTVAENSLKTIESYEDANFYFCVNNNDQMDEYLIKFYNAVETSFPENFHGLSGMLRNLTEKVWDEVKVPKIIVPTTASAENDFIFVDNCPLTNSTYQSVAIRVFAWIAGTTLSRNTNISNTVPLFRQVGNAIGLFNQALLHFNHPAFQREHIWDLKQFHLSIHLIDVIDDALVRDCIADIYATYQTFILPQDSILPHSVIMADCNDANIIITPNGEEVVGLIDFSDAIYTWSVNELAIAMAYGLISAQSIQGSTPASNISTWAIAEAIFLGYIKHRKLTAEELTVLPILMAVRISISVMVGAYSIAKQPDNEYLKVHAVPGRKALVAWWTGSTGTMQAGFHSTYAKQFEAVQDSAL